jgi:hypothetical protein
MTPEYVARYRALAAEVVATARQQLRPHVFVSWLRSSDAQIWLAWLPGLSVEAVRDQIRREQMQVNTGVHLPDYATGPHTAAHDPSLTE